MLDELEPPDLIDDDRESPDLSGLAAEIDRATVRVLTLAIKRAIEDLRCEVGDKVDRRHVMESVAADLERVL